MLDFMRTFPLNLHYELNLFNNSFIRFQLSSRAFLFAASLPAPRRLHETVTRAVVGHARKSSRLSSLADFGIVASTRASLPP